MRPEWLWNLALSGGLFSLRFPHNILAVLLPAAISLTSLFGTSKPFYLLQLTDASLRASINLGAHLTRVRSLEGLEKRSCFF